MAIRILLLSTLGVVAISGSVAHAQDVERVPTPAEILVREHMAIAVLDLCLPVVDGADMASSPALAVLGGPKVETADYDPDVRTLVTDDGVNVLRSTTRSCSAQYLAPETATPVGEGEEAEVGDSLNALIKRLDAPGSGWMAQPGSWGEMPPYVSDDFRFRIDISLRDDSASITRLLNDPETVRAYYARIARADARSGPEAIVEAASLCAAYTVTPVDEPEGGSEAWEKAGELPDYEIEGAPVGRSSNAAALRGHLDAWLTPGEDGCSIQANAQPDFPHGDLGTLRSGVLSLLKAEGSGWTTSSPTAWTRADGTGLTFGDGDADSQIWTVVPHS